MQKADTCRNHKRHMQPVSLLLWHEIVLLHLAVTVIGQAGRPKFRFWQFKEKINTVGFFLILMLGNTIL